MQVRRAQIQDLEQVLFRYKKLNPEDAPLPLHEVINQKWKQILGRYLIYVYVAEQDKKLLGTYMLTVVPNLTRGCLSFGLIEKVVTDHDFRRKGIGCKLLKTALDQAWQDGCYKVMLVTGSKRPEILFF